MLGQTARWFECRLRCFIGAVAVSLLLLAGCQSGGRIAAPVVDTTSPPQERLQPVAEKWLVPDRLVEYSFHLPGVLLSDARVEVLFPARYFDPRNTARRYPTVWMLHGGNSGPEYYNSQMLFDADNQPIGVATKPVIAVLPYAGVTGFYVNWFNFGMFGPPQWETFHIDLLMPWIDEQFRTIPDRSRRWVIGGSMGGFGAVSYSGRFPDRFGAVASISGELDHNNPIAQVLVGAGGISPGEQPSAPPFSIWGLYQTEEVRWRGDNPVDLAANLSNTNILLCRGDGVPASGSVPAPDTLSSYATEASFIAQENEAFHARLVALGLEHQYFVEAGGDHVTPLCFPHVYDWLDALLADSNGLPPAPPPFFRHVSIKEGYSVFDWRIQFQRDALEFSAIEVMGARWFDLIGSGTATVTTAALYQPETSYRISITDSEGTTAVRSVAADARGRLLLVDIPLGPANPYQQLSPQADAAGVGHAAQSGMLPFYTRGGGSRFYRTSVTIGS